MFLFDTPTLRRKSARLGKPEAVFLHFLAHLGVAVLRVDEPFLIGIALLRLGIPVSPVLVPLFRYSNNHSLD